MIFREDKADRLLILVRQDEHATFYPPHTPGVTRKFHRENVHECGATIYVAGPGRSD